MTYFYIFILVSAIVTYPKFISLIKEQNFGVATFFDYLIASVFAIIPFFNIYVTFLILPPTKTKG